MNAEELERMVFPPLPVWAMEREVSRITGAPRSALIGWAIEGKVAVRKFGSSRQAKLVYRVADVLRLVDEMPPAPRRKPCGAEGKQGDGVTG